MIFGAEMMRTMPGSSAAERRRLRLKLPPTEPSVKPSAPPSPVPIAAGRLTAKFGWWRRGHGRPSGVWESSSPPATPSVDGKTRPVGLPVAAEASALTPHWMPIWRVQVERRLDDARLDRDLRRLGVELAQEPR